MNFFNKNARGLASLGGLLMAVLAPQALADGTAAGTQVTNTASVEYQVGGVAQTPVDSNDEVFTVDRVIRMTLTPDDSPVTTVPGATAQVTTYTLTNTSNDTLDFDLSAINAANADMGALGTDNIDASSVTVFWDTNGNGVYDPGTDTATTVDNLTGDAGGSDDNQTKVFVVVDVPSTATDSDILGVELTASALDGDGSALTETSGANTTGEDTVFGDIAGATDGARDAAISSYGAYALESASIAVAKSSEVIEDPFNGTTDPKFIPGATVEYCMVVTNSGSAAATDVTLTDDFPSQTTYVANSIATGTGGTCGANTDGTPLGSESGGEVTATFTSVGASNSVWVSFQVTLN